VNTTEIPGARVRVSAAGSLAEVVTDDEGYFDLELEAGEQPFASPRQVIDLELLEPATDEPVTARGEVVVRSPSSSFLVISDIDDTVVETEATNLLAMARATFLGNARSRTPFPGVGRLYKALVDGPSGEDENPLVFISRSPWNLYDLFDQFCDLQGIPGGRVFYLRDWGFSLEGLTRARPRGHKFELIRRILELEPDLPVILIGDSGQKDPEIYHAISEEHPGRLLGAFIRNVTKSRKRDESIRNLATEVREDGAVLYLADDSLGVARLAAEHGWIRREAVDEVAAGPEAGDTPPDPLDELLETPPESRADRHQDLLDSDSA
jgi:phosphatidate phosphatase APP1